MKVSSRLLRYILALVAVTLAILFFSFRGHVIVWNIANGNVLNWEGRQVKIPSGLYLFPNRNSTALFLFSLRDWNSLVEISQNTLTQAQLRDCVTKTCIAMACSTLNEKVEMLGNREIVAIEYLYRGADSGEIYRHIWFLQNGKTLVTYSGNAQGFDRVRKSAQDLVLSLSP